MSSPAPHPDPASPNAPAGAPPFLTVVMRTQGRRPRLLADALAGLSAQTDPDFEVCLVRHDGPDPAANAEAAAAVADVLDAAPSTVRARTRGLVAPPGRRGVPLNVGIDAATGAYVAFLDDDDAARTDWVAAFRRGAAAAPGALVRARAVAQHAHVEPDGTHRLAERTEAVYRARFDLLDHLFENRTPICAVAWPAALFREGGVRVDEELGALEDWDLLLQAVGRVPVHEVDAATSVYRWWTDDSGSKGAEQEAGWEQARRRVLARLAERSLVVPPTALPGLLDGAGELSEFRRFAGELRGDALAGPFAPDDPPPAVVRREFERLHRRMAELLGDIGELRVELAAAQAARAEADAALAAVRRSVSWRVTAPLRAVAGEGSTR